MIKYFISILIVILIGLSSCSDDDQERERVVGNWILQSVEPSSVFDPEACPNNSTVEINGNNTLTATFNFTETNCEGSPEDGTWQKTGASLYVMTFPAIGRVSGSVSFPSSDRMIFSSENGVVFTFQRQL